jgi:phage FluMu gp28-like protein
MKEFTPRDVLKPYQLRWVMDEARFKIGMWSRQTGKSFACAAELVEQSLATPKSFWVVLSAGERQALEFMLKVKEWTTAYQVVLSDYREERSGPEALIKAAEVKWPNGSRCLALPANPDTARGYSANLVLDEFAFHEDPDGIWRAIYPSISNPLKGIKKIRIVSTPNGKSNKFAGLMLKDNVWSKHTVTIYDAVAQGLPVNIDELRAGLDDPDGWAQEYECQFIDDAAILLPYELIQACESAEATAIVAAEFWEVKQPATPRFMGIDFGRKRDLSVAWTCERLGDVLHTREVLELPKMSTPDQIAKLRPRIHKVQRVCLDYTGPGVGLGDYLAKEFGEYNPDQDKFGKIELCNFSNTFKQDVFPKLKMRFEARGIRIPVSRVIREDLHAISRVVTQTGQVSYRAPHTEDGHSDRATALALCVRAGGTKAGPFAYRRVEVRRTGLRSRGVTI